MNNSGDAAEQVVRLSLEGFEVVAKVSGEAAKNIAVLLLAALKQEQKAKGKARLSNLIKSGKELKVFSIPQKDLKKFTEQAKRYGVLYSVLKDRNAKGKNVTVDIIARAEDASKIDRIIERFKLGTVDKGSITNELEKSVSEKTNGDLILEHIEAKSTEEKDKNPSLSRTEKDSLSKSSSKAINDKDAKDKKQSVKELLDGYKDEIKADRAKDIADKSKTVADTVVKSVKSIKER